LRISGARELEEGRGGNEAPPAACESPALRTEVEHRPALRPCRRQAEPHLDELHMLTRVAHDRPEIADPDVVGPRQIELALMRGDAELQFAHHPAIFCPGDMLLIVVAHGAS